MLCGSESKVHVNVVSVSLAAIYPSVQVTTHASPKVKEEQSEPSTVSSLRSILLRQDKALQTEVNGVVSLTRKPLDPQDRAEDVTSTGAKSSKQLAHRDSGKAIPSQSWLVPLEYRSLRTSLLDILEDFRDSHGAVPVVKGASQSAGATRVVRGAHRLARVSRGPVQAIWRQH